MPASRDQPDFEADSAVVHADLEDLDAADSEECEVASAAIQPRRVQDAIFIVKIFTPIIPALINRLRMVVDSEWNMPPVLHIHKGLLPLLLPGMVQPTQSQNPASKLWSAM
jgi:hypothetical protein